MKFRYLDARVCVLALLLRRSLCETETSVSTDELLEIYKGNFETAIEAERFEKIYTKNITDEFRINVVNKMTEHRLEMMIHRNFSLGQDSNEKWLQCVETKNEHIKQIEEVYTHGETECVNNAHILFNDKKQALKQIIKEIRDWRKGYKYLQNLCKEHHVITKENTGKCLTEYMQEDSYSTAVERLLELLKMSQAELRTDAEESLINLDVCLRSEFSKYLSGLRRIRGVLNKCYKRTNIVKIQTKDKVGCVSLHKLNCISE